MRYIRRLRCLLIVVAMLPGMAGIIRADDTSLKSTPDIVTKGSTQPVRFTWSTTLAATDSGLLKARKATVGGRDAIIAPDPTQQSIILTLPPLDVIGNADVRIMDDKDQLIAVGALRYVGTADIAATTEATRSGKVVILYAVLVVLFPFLLMWTDILKAYTFARETRRLLMEKFSADRLTLDELKVVVADFDSSPPGIPGLARATFAFTLLLIIGLILFYVLVLSGSDIPPGVEKLLTILGTALTSIIAFYFGSRATETGQQMAAGGSGGTSTSGSKPGNTVTPVPNHAKVTEEIVLKSEGFGESPGSVTFGSTSASVVSWSDREVRVKVPTSVSGKLTIIVNPVGRAPIASAAAAFSVDE